MWKDIQKLFKMITITKDQFPKLEEGLLKYNEALDSKRASLLEGLAQSKLYYQRSLAEKVNQSWLSKLFKKTISEDQIPSLSLDYTEYELEYQAFDNWTNHQLTYVWEQKTMVIQVLSSIRTPLTSAITLHPQFYSSLITYIATPIKEYAHEEIRSSI